MKILLVDNGTSYLSELHLLLKKHQVETVPFEALKQNKYQEYQLIILSGGHKYAVMSHKRKYAKELSLIRQTNVPVIGICLGFELIVVAFGGKLKLLRRRVHEMVNITFAHNDALQGDKSEYQVFESHRRGVKVLPSELEVLARSDNGIEIVRHRSRPIYGFQFHPEKGTGGDGRGLITRAINELEQF